jgi:hypothetical protein
MLDRAEAELEHGLRWSPRLSGRIRNLPPSAPVWVGAMGESAEWAVAAMESSYRYHIAAPMFADL